MTFKDFRRIALALDGAMEGVHMGHPDFRANGRIFATIRHDQKTGMVKLKPDQQQKFVRDYPAGFSSEAGAWGRSGCTRVLFEAVDEETMGEALTLAWQGTAREKKKSVKPRRQR